MFKTPISDADVVYIFQWPTVNAKLAEKLKRELRPGAFVVSYMWEVPDLRLTTYEPKLRIYIYEI
jgi:SAM-dependent methyltransferases